MTDEQKFFARQDRAADLAAIHAAAERGDRLTKRERLMLWHDKVETLNAEIAPLLRAGKVRSAIDRVMMTVAAHSIQQAAFYDALEDRLIALERRAEKRAEKPRIRVPAGSRPRLIA